jgi:hypothetical protein
MITMAEEGGEKKKTISMPEYARALADEVEKRYDLLTFESNDPDRVDVYFRDQDGTYREAKFLAAMIQDMVDKNEVQVDGIPPSATTRLISETIAMIKRDTMVPSSVIDDRADRIKVKNGVLVFFETKEHMIQTIRERLDEAIIKTKDPAVKSRAEYISFQIPEWDLKVGRNRWNPHLEDVPEVHSEDLPAIAKEIREGKPHKWAFLSGLPVEYDPDADCPTFLNFLKQILPDERDRLTIQEIFGSFLYRLPVDRAFFFFGEGANGKSTLIKVMMAFLGKENIATRSLQEILTNRFAKADLYGKLANLYYDMPSTALLSTGDFKALTSGDLMTTERKFKDSFQFENYAKMVFSGNAVPQTRDETDAFFRRWVIISFPFQFLPPETVSRMLAEGEFEGEGGGKAAMTNIRIAVPQENLLAEMTSPRELSGILNWALEGLKRLIDHRFHFSSELTIEETHEKYLALSNTVHAFVSEECEITGEKEDRVDKNELYQAYAAYCKRKNLSPASYSWFFRKLLQESTMIAQERPRTGGNRAFVIAGLRLKKESLQ